MAPMSLVPLSQCRLFTSLSRDGTVRGASVVKRRIAPDFGVHPVSAALS